MTACPALPSKSSSPEMFVALILDGQLCGIPVLSVRTVLAGQTIAPVPLSPPEIAGNLNLRGRIVTVIELREKFGLPRRPTGMPTMSLVVELGRDLYALQVDDVTEVIAVDRGKVEQLPAALPIIWKTYGSGICRTSNGVIVLLDIDRLMRCDPETVT